MTVTCNQLVQEFMSGILRITNDANEDDVKDLQDYLLGGQGVYLLKVIQKIGVKVSGLLFEHAAAATSKHPIYIYIYIYIGGVSACDVMLSSLEMDTMT